MIDPSCAPSCTADVDIVAPSSKLGEPLTLPLILPSSYCIQLYRIGIIPISSRDLLLLFMLLLVVVRDGFLLPSKLPSSIVGLGLVGCVCCCCRCRRCSAGLS